MNQLEKQLFRDNVGDAEPRLQLRTKTRVDTGRWWRKTPLWLCVMDDELVLLSVSRRRYIERLPLSASQQTHYNHSTGELVIEPAESLQCNRCALSPRDALRVLNFLKSKKTTKH
ncbi:hypothetical protein [Rubritalea profundi]|uniref:YokE-like PH domain-containing protein n=1 Tax=Rubritalea profundi TaxID=1658618 RepID=A0A2S7TYC4_9BACT|nr:hypothetical protein [Rubritalea profundi]PQJ27755.1 hypothetical protein BSZ32_04050 [Rubritalea profundi]